MKKITELTEVKLTNTHYRDEYGTLIRAVEEITVFRTVNSVSKKLRFVHYIIDGIFILIIYMLLLLIAIIINEANGNALSNLLGNDGMSNTVFLIVFAAYYGLFESKYQKTPAKFITRTVVIDEYGNKADFRSRVIRALARIIGIEAVFFLLGGDDRTWHDSWSDTWVVKDTELAEIKRLQVEQSGD